MGSEMCIRDRKNYAESFKFSKLISLTGDIPYKRIGCFKGAPLTIAEGPSPGPFQEKLFEEDKAVYLRPTDLTDSIDEIICR